MYDYMTTFQYYTVFYSDRIILLGNEEVNNMTNKDDNDYNTGIILVLGRNLSQQHITTYAVHDSQVTVSYTSQ